MAGKKSTPEQVAQVVVLREAGYTTAMISQKTLLSPATVKRLCSVNKVSKGCASEHLVAVAREEVMGSIAGNEELKELTAKMIADNLAISSVIRDKVLESVGKLNPTDTGSAALCLRGLAAASTSLKGTTDAVKTLLGFEHLQGSIESLEELTFYDLTDVDIKDMRRQQSEEMKILNGEFSEQDSHDELKEVEGGGIVDEVIH